MHISVTFISTLLFCLLDLHTGHWSMETGIIRKESIVTFRKINIFIDMVEN